MSNSNLESFTDVLGDEICDSQPISLPSSNDSAQPIDIVKTAIDTVTERPAKHTGQYEQFRSIDEIDPKYRSVFSYPFFNLVQSSVIEDALYTDKSMVVCAPTGSGKTVVFEMAIVQLLMEMEDKCTTEDFKIIYMAPVKALCTERLTEWYPKFTRLGLLCIEVTGDTDVDFSMLKPYRIIITTPEKWDMLTRRWRDHRSLVEVIKVFLIDEVHILNDEVRGPVLEAVVSRMKTIESSAQSAHRIELLQRQYQGSEGSIRVAPPRIRFVAVSATVSNPDDVAAWLTSDKPAVYYKFGDECRPVKLKRVVEGYPCAEGTSIFKFDIILNYKLWPIIQKYHNGKPTLIFCNTRKSVALTAETLSRELTISFSPEQKAKLTALASTIKNKKLQSLVLNGVGCHHAGLLFEERTNIELAFRNRDLPILITTTTLAMGVNLPAHLVIIKNTQQYVNGAYQEYSISTVLQMVGRAGRPQFDTEATAVIMTRLHDKPRYQALVGGSEPLQSYLHKRLAENLNSEAALGTVTDVAQCVQWLRSTFLSIRAARDPKRYLGLPPAAPQQLISKKIEELCVKAMNGLATWGLITMDEASCIESTEAGRLMSIFYLDLETMKHIMKINGTESLERLLWIVCESHELADMHLRVDERRSLNALNRNQASATIRFPMKGKISTKQMKVNCMIQAILGCLPIPDPSLNQEAMKIMRIADRVCKCLVAYVTRPDLISQKPQYFAAVLNSVILTKCVASHLWENSPFVSKQLKGIGPTFSTLLATAGKVNFMLLEESHPRDLERIMNKGPPAGNVLRKQISLLPKYQLTMTPVDEKSVTIQLTLLNQIHLSENMDQLTAGDNHKSFIVVGDSENHVLWLTAFKDKDLIRVYDGSITYRIPRKHTFEHKVLAHCISSSFAGIDAQCEYLFNDLEPLRPNVPASINEVPINIPATKQTCITDTFKERKRKCTDLQISQSKEKKKRDSTLIEKFKYLKESFGKTSKELKKDLDKSTTMPKNILQELNHCDKPGTSDDIFSGIKNDENICNQSNKNYYFDELATREFDFDEMYGEDFINDENIESILTEIESEIISKENKKPDLLKQDKSPKLNAKVYGSNAKNTGMSNLVFYKDKSYNVKTMTQRSINSKADSCKSFDEQNKRQNKKTKSNYNFIDLLEKNLDLSDEEGSLIINESGFSNTIKSHVEKYLEKAHNTTKLQDRTIKELLHDTTEISSARKELVEKRIDNICIQNEQDRNNTVLEVGCNDIDRVTNCENEAETKNGKIIELTKLHEENDANADPSYHEIKTISMPFCDTVNNKVNINQNITVDSGLNRNMLRLYELDMENSILDSCTVTLSGTKPIDFQTTPIPITNKLPLRKDLKINKPLSNRETENKNIHSYGPIHKAPFDSTVFSLQQHDKYGNNSRTEYVKKYSYTTTKIDVCTKNLADHTVQVIRKLKVDLDITEIVSQEKMKNRNNATKVQERDQMSNDSKCIDFNFRESIGYDTSSCSDIVSQNKTELILYNNATSNHKKEFTSNSFSEKEQTEKTNILDESEQFKTKTNIQESDTNKVENILQKYSKVLQKTYTDVAPPDTKLSTFNIRNNNSPKLKTKRLFKITDIDRFTAPLQTDFINETHSVLFPKVVRGQTEERLENNNLNQDKGIDIIPIHELDRISPIPTDLHTQANLEDYKIDQSMFNPQTLLQCYSNDEPFEVVPPPPQFCDEYVSYSPNCNQSTNDSIAALDCFDPSQWCDDINDISSEIGYDRSIFEDSHDVQLTPSKEIETWTLSQNDPWKKPNTLNQIQSFTVMHKSSPANSLLHNVTATRQAKLDQFKLGTKNKLKLRM